MNHWFKHSLKTIVLPYLCLFITQPGYADQASINNDILQLDAAFKNLSETFYHAASNNTEEYPQPIVDVDLLLSAVNKLQEAGHTIEAIRLIHLNTETIKENLDSETIFSFIELLLDNNVWNLASTLLKEVEDANDQSILVTIQFLFAKYHARHHDWIQVNNLLEGHFSELSEEDTGYAYLLNGIALQHMKKHRQAINNYEKVLPSSQYYSHAQLNMAIANIRLGWWTDAQIKIKDQLKRAGKTNRDELTNRLYLVLGYALLQKEYYRDSRDAFRHIGLESRYTNRALLGIGLTATSQGDYVGAINALTILKNKKTFDLSVDESYLLIPYVYEKLQQEITVSTAYTEAMKYYRHRVAGLNNIAGEHIDINNLKYKSKTSSFIIDNNNFDYGARYPESFLKNFHRLKDFHNFTNDSKLKNKISRLIAKFNTTLQEVIADLVGQRKEYLNSYLNQSRYGLARLYDNSKKTGD